MATVKIDTFGGIAPRQHPTLLADGMAVTAHNCRLKSGKLVPLRQPAEADGVTLFLEGGLSQVAAARSMHVWRKTGGDFDLLLFKGVTWAAPGNIADDDCTRLIVSGDRTGDGTTDEPVLYMRSGSAVVRHPIVKDPLGHSDGSSFVTAYPIVSRDSEAPALEGNIRYTRFFFTWVDEYGYESPVSLPSRNFVAVGQDPVDDDLEYLDGDKIEFKPLAEGDIPAGLRKLRIYKVITGTSEGRIQFIAERTRGEILDETKTPSEPQGIFVTVKDENAGEIMPEIEAPPRDLSCIHDVPGSFYCGFAASSPKTVCFSDIDLLYSWPYAYRYDVADNIVALAVTSNSVFALTDGWPYVLSGTAPESMSVAKLAGPAACVSARGVCVYRNAVYFVSNAGLMSIFNSADAGTVCQNITDKIFTKEQWLALNPSSCVMGQHDGALMLFFQTADGPKGLSVDLMENSKIAVTTHDEVASCMAIDNRADNAYFVRTGREA